MKQVRWFKDQLSESGMQTKWMKFFILWFLPANIAFCVFMIICCVICLAMNIPSLGRSVWIDSGFIFFNIPFLAFTAFVYWFSIRLRPLGYRLLIAFCIVDIAVRIISFVIYGLMQMEQIASQVTNILAMVIPIVNIVYFSKRKQLFGLAKPTG